MKKKKLLILLISALLVVLAACGGGKTSGNSNGKGGPKLIRTGTPLNPDHPTYLGLVKFKEIVEERTNGEITVETYHSAQLGDDRSMIENTQLGSQEVAIAGNATLGNFVPEYKVLEFPFLFPNEEVTDVVLDGEIGQKLFEKLPQHDFVGLAYWENGFRHVTNSKRPVETVEDLKGLKLRTMENELHIEAFQALGANPTPMSFGELFSGMQQGTVDGQENPYVTIALSKFNEVQDYISNTGHVYSPSILVVNKSFYEGLTEEQQQILREAGIEAGNYQRKLNREANVKYLEELQEQGMKFTEITPENREKMIQKVKPVIEKHSESVGVDFVKEVYQAVEEAQQ